MKKKTPHRISFYLERWARDLPDKLFLFDQKRNTGLDFHEVHQHVKRACCYFERLGLKKGDIITLYLENGLEFCLLFLASLEYGTVAFLYPSMFSPVELLRDLQFIKSRAVFVQTVKKHAFERRGLKNLVFVDSEKPESFLDKIANSGYNYRKTEKNDDDFACLFPSAGASFHPRGIYYTHKNIMALIPSVCRGFRFEADDVHLILLPLAHSASLNYSLLPALVSGSSVVLTEGFWNIRDKFWKLCKEHAVTYVETIPTVLYALLHLPKTFEPVPCLKYIGCGSAPLDKKMQTEFMEKFGLPVANLYGLTETGPIHVDYPLNPDWKPGSIGRPLDVNQIIIADKKGNPLVSGKKGEILVKGDNVFPGYAIKPELTSHSFVHGYFRTGDIGYMDDDGLCYFSHRTKELIIRGGLNIHPDEINEVLLSNPDVLSCKTYGCPDDFFGEKIKSDVTVKSRSCLSQQDLKELCSTRLSPIKIPDIIHLGNRPEPV